MTLKLALGGSFVVGAIFWAGSTYDRVAGIESSLIDIRAQLPALGRVAVLDAEVGSLQKQMDYMQQQIDLNRKRIDK
jgi:capsule polysaccharide export protein KpsE/RkpR